MAKFSSPRKMASALLGIGRKEDPDGVAEMRREGRKWLRAVARGEWKCYQVKRTRITAAQAYMPPWDLCRVYDRNVPVRGMDKEGNRYLLQFAEVERWVEADYPLYAEEEIE